MFCILFVKFLLQLFGSLLIVIPNCIRVERFVVTDEIKNNSLKIKEEYKDKTIIFTYGRHVPYKGYKYLIEASKYLSTLSSSKYILQKSQ